GSTTPAVYTMLPQQPQKSTSPTNNPPTNKEKETSQPAGQNNISGHTPSHNIHKPAPIQINIAEIPIFRLHKIQKHLRGSRVLQHPGGKTRKHLSLLWKAVASAEGDTISIKRHSCHTAFADISEWLLAFKAYIDAVLIIYENREQELNTYRDHISELCLKQSFYTVMSYDEDRRVTLVTNRDSTLLDRKNGITEGRFVSIGIEVTAWMRKSVKGSTNGIKLQTCRSIQSSPRNHYVRGSNPSISQLTLTAIHPHNMPLTATENEIYTQLDPDIFSIFTPINIEMFTYLTNNHPNRPFISYLLKGLRDGFRFNFSGQRTRLVQQNLKSIEIDPLSFARYIQDELAQGRMCGPFSEQQPPCQLFQINPCGLVAKKDTNPKVYRVISHLSAPFGANAYRILPVHPVDQTLQGIIFEGQIDFDKALAFGNRASGGIFCRFADVLTWIATQQG
ncbi:4468_t:CDS:2, partial [Ambispora leptoticha]